MVIVSLPEQMVDEQLHAQKVFIGDNKEKLLVIV